MQNLLAFISLFSFNKENFVSPLKGIAVLYSSKINTPMSKLIFWGATTTIVVFGGYRIIQYQRMKHKSVEEIMKEFEN